MTPALLLSLVLAQGPQVLTFDEAMRLAAENNLDLKAARSRLVQADEISRKAWSGYLPSVTVGGSFTYNPVAADPLTFPGPGGVPVEIEIQKKDTWNGQVRVQQALLVPQLWPAINSASLAERAAKLNVENARREILFATAQLYYTAEGLREAVDVQRQLLALNQRHEQDATLKVKVGEAPRVALLRAQIELARSEQDVRRTEAAYASAKSGLATLLNREPDFEVTQPPKPQRPENMDQLAVQAAQLRPDVQAARTNVELSRSNRMAVLAKYLPSLFGFAQGQGSNVTGFVADQYFTYALGVQLQWNLLDGGLREAEQREAAAKIVESLASAEAAEDRATDEVRRAIYDLESAEANLTIAQEQRRLAQENADLINKSFEAGAASYIEVLDANGALTSSALNHINEQLNSQLAVIKLARAAGLFDPLKKEAQQ